jgi:hypothetical protein
VSKVAHLAGIVPVADSPKGFNMVWDDCMMPVAPNYHAAEMAVYNCAMAGCDTIWVVCNYETKPLLRKRMGDYTIDPVTVGSHKFALAPNKYRKYIPIYYVPVPQNFSHKYYCLPWSILQGAITSYNVSAAISKWTCPDHYFVSFPFGVIPTNEIRPIRRELTKGKNVLFRHNNQTILDQKLLPFTFDNEDFKFFLDNFKQEEAKIGSQMDVKEQSEHFTTQVGLVTLFHQLEIDQPRFVDLSWFRQIDSWDKYCEYLGSQERQEVKFPGRIFIHYHEWNPTAEDIKNAQDEEDDDASE